MSFVDFAELKTRISIESVIQMLGLKLRQTGSQLRGPCPICKVGGDLALVVTPARDLFYCFAAKAGGDQIALVAHIKNISVKEAAGQISDHFQARNGGTGTVQVHSTSAPTVPPAQSTKTGFDPDAYASRLDPAQPALAPLGISPDTFKVFQSGYASTGLNRGRLALRLDDRQGICVGYLGYALSEQQQPKIIAPNGVNLGDHLFGASRVQPGPLYLVRDPLQVLAAYENGVENVVSFLSDITAQGLVMLTSLMDTVGCETVELF